MRNMQKSNVFDEVILQTSRVVNGSMVFIIHSEVCPSQSVRIARVSPLGFARENTGSYVT